MKRRTGDILYFENRKFPVTIRANIGKIGMYLIETWFVDTKPDALGLWKHSIKCIRVAKSEAVAGHSHILYQRH